MSKKPKPPKVLWVVYDFDNEERGYGRTKRDATREATGPFVEWKELQDEGYTVHKYILEEPCQNQ